MSRTQIYREMLAEAEITPIMNERLDRERGVKKIGPRIESIAIESGRTFAGARCSSTPRTKAISWRRPA